MRLLASLALGLACLALLCGISFASTQEAMALLEFQSSLDTVFTGWNLGNIGNLCSNWEGIYCNAAGNVTTVSIGRDNYTSGTFNPALFRLTELTTLQFYRIFFLGECPAEIFQFPKLSVLSLRELGCHLNWPRSVSPTLSNLNIKFANITEPMPDVFPWETMAVISVYYASLPCPLPAGLVARFRSGQPLTCQLQANSFDMVDGMICNQIAMVDIPCRTCTPIVPYLASPAVSRTYNVSYGSLHLEFEDYTVRVFGKTRAGLIHRDDYFSLNVPPLQPILQPAGTASRNFHSSPFTAPRWSDSKTVYVNYTMVSRLNEVIYGSFIFQFDRNDGNININGKSIKFSAYLNNVNATFSSSRVMFSLLSKYHTQHSPPGGTPMLCPEWDFTKYEACSSSVANLTFDLTTTQAGNFLDTSVIGLENDKVFISFGYGLIGEIDGNPLLSDSRSSVVIDKHFTGIGLSSIIDTYLVLNRTELAPRANAAKDQALLLLIGLEMPAFNTLYYDPDISLSLLFDTDAPAPSPSTGGVQENVVGSANLGLIVGLTMGGVVLVAAIVGLVLFVRTRSARVAQREAVQQRLASANYSPSNTGAASAGSGGHVSAQAQREGRSDSKWVQPDVSNLEATNVVLDS
eukprot:TRINITY_DN5102_c0_g2_i1.p1 TRINITY_DN5102_c0_g2~~TRINITY_DN5102_c0_g2_i1.p1  ORF type:complete len:632 (+),score=72.09 TRINITY_DN5102_c0_g2_i1:80-1975(+)